MFDENVNIGSHNRAGRDQFINIYGKSKDYQELEHKLAAQERDRDKLVRRIEKYPDDEDFQQDLRDCNKRLAKTRKEIEEFKEDVFRLHELFTRIPIDNERLRRAKAHFDKGEFREADAVLKAGEIQQDVERLKLEEKAAVDRLTAVRKDLEGRANEFLLKARLSLLNPVAEGEDRFSRTEQWFNQALATARTAEVLLEYAFFLWKQNVFSRAEPLYEKALTEYRNKAAADPEAFLPYVADTLNNLALLHSKTGEYSLALKEHQEALKIRRRLAADQPKAFLPDLANTLNNLAGLHYATGEYDLALKEYQEAIKLYHRLAADQPKAFLPDVAMTLNNLAVLHQTTGEYGLALKEYQEALKIRRRLAADQPKAFLPDVAMTLNNLGELHRKTGEYGPALKEYEEALKIRRRLAADQPKAFLPYVADTLNNLANLHYATGEYSLALKEYEEALKIRRRLAAKEPGAFSQTLVETLLNLSLFYLGAVPDKAKSVTYAQEARDILKPLIQQAPHLQKYLDLAEEVLERNKTQPDA
ncbi:MAG: tetratricopeptide repeat protein [Candidatus Electrothrix sp. AX2]|nr:tetratricopeptide repeat protein [Candidatus Electrothrix gigas]